MSRASLRPALRHTLHHAPAPAAPAGGTSNLYTKLVAFWKLDEASGNRADSIGTNTLVDTNTVTSNTGLVYATAAEFTAANSERLTIADNTVLSTGDVDFAFGCWVYWTGSGTQVFLSKYSDYQLYTTGAPTLLWQIPSAAAGSRSVTGFTTNAWHWAFCWHDAANNVLGVSLNNGTPNTGATTGAPADTNAAFNLGSQQAGVYFNGRIGPAMMWKNYIPTAAEQTFLYNAGAGRTLAAIQAYTP